MEPLRAAARDASVHGHLVVARHSYGSAALDTYTTQLRQITAAALTPRPAAEHSTGPDTPGPLAGQEADRQLRRTPSDAPASGPAPVRPEAGGVFWVTSDDPARRPDIAGDLETKRQFLADLRAEEPERRRRARQLISPHGPADASEAEPLSSADLGAALQDPGTRRAVQARAAQLQAATEQRLRQAAEALAHRDTTAAPPQHASRPSGQQPQPPAAPPQQGPRP
ncbi:hypothetical protein [Streptomyces collinus]|uniref:hypothetical protein n=1 Tax=Streptomyces collinus TaxID=42684 RepID=UPI0036895FEB